MNVWAGTITSSPGPMPAACSMMVRAAVPDATPTQCRTPQYAANSASNRSTSSPSTNALEAHHTVKRRLQAVGDGRVLPCQIDEWHPTGHGPLLP